MSGGGIVSTSIAGDTLTISATEGDGSATNELQNLFQTVIADAGSTVANSQTDALTVAGGGIVSTSVAGDTVTISATEVDGSTTNELQSLFATVTADSGNTTANLQNDTLNIVGGTNITTSISGDTLTITGSGGSGVTADSLDFTEFSDAMSLDATTTVNMDANAADLDFDGQTLFLDSSENRVGLGTGTPEERLHVTSGNILQSPGVPTLLGSATTNTGHTRVVIAGRCAYVLAGGANTLYILDVSDPSAPSLLGSVSVGGFVRGFAVSGRYAYITDSFSQGIFVIDVSDPSAPVSVGSMSLPQVPTAIQVSGRYAYVVELVSDNFHVVDISDPVTPTLVGTLGVGGNPASIQVSGRYAYLTDTGTDDLKVIDVSNPAAPSQVGSLALGSNPSSLSVSGLYAYVADGVADDLRVIDLTDPTAPSLAGSTALGASPREVFVSGRYAYVVEAGGSGAIKIFDVSDPTAPSLDATLPLGAGPRAVAVAGRYAYVLDDTTQELRIVDISGAEVTSMMAHSLEAGNLQVLQDIKARGGLEVSCGVTVGAGGLYSDGDIGVSGSLALANDTAPSTSLTNGVLLYAQDVSSSSELRVRDEAGNVTTLSPHNFSLIGEPSEPLAWSYYSENDQDKINVDMLRTVRLVEKLTGEKLVHLESAAGAESKAPAGMLSLLVQRLDELEAKNRALAEELARVKSRWEAP